MRWGDFPFLVKSIHRTWWKDERCHVSASSLPLGGVSLVLVSVIVRWTNPISHSITGSHIPAKVHLILMTVLTTSLEAPVFLCEPSWRWTPPLPPMENELICSNKSDEWVTDKLPEGYHWVGLERVRGEMWQGLQKPYSFNLCVCLSVFARSWRCVCTTCSCVGFRGKSAHNACPIPAGALLPNFTLASVTPRLDEALSFHNAGLDLTAAPTPLPPSLVASSWRV